MSERSALNISYEDFLTSVRDKHDKISCHKMIVPEFQRNYVWKKNQIDELIDSICDNEANYYLGNLVVVKEETERSKIVDGQQRLTTLSFMACILASLTQSSENKTKLNNLVYAGESVPRILFRKNNINEAYISLIDQVSIDTNNLDQSQKSLFAAYENITTKLSSVSDIDSFIDKFIALEFVVISCVSDEDAYILFEGLNSTGLTLSAVELSKNSILGKIKSLDATRVEEAVTLWDEIEKRFEDTKISWFNKFLRHHWFSKKGYVSNSNLFKEIKTNLVNTASTVEQLFEYLNELKVDSHIYIALRNGTVQKRDFDELMTDYSWNRTSEIITAIEKLGLDQIYSVLLALHKYGRNNPDYFRKDRLRLHVEKLWNFLLVVKYSNISPASYERKFSSFCINIKTLDYTSFKTAADTFFVELGLKINNLKNDFSYSFARSINYFTTDRGFVRLILLDYLLAAGEGADNHPRTEHIIPESNWENWGNIADTTNLANNVGLIGNLSLLNNDLNNDAGHNEFNIKYDLAYSKSRFTVNSRLNTEWGSQFTSEDPINNAVIPRGKVIGELIFDTYLQNLNT